MVRRRISRRVETNRLSSPWKITCGGGRISRRVETPSRCPDRSGPPCSPGRISRRVETAGGRATRRRQRASCRISRRVETSSCLRRRKAEGRRPSRISRRVETTLHPSLTITSKRDRIESQEGLKLYHIAIHATLNTEM